MNINSLKNFVTRNVGIDEMVGARAELKSLAVNYDDLQLSVPEWISNKLSEVEMEISSQSRAEKLATLAKLRSRRSALMTTDEKRKAVDDQIASLEAGLK